MEIEKFEVSLAIIDQLLNFQISQSKTLGRRVSRYSELSELKRCLYRVFLLSIASNSVREVLKRG